MYLKHRRDTGSEGHRDAPAESAVEGALEGSPGGPSPSTTATPQRAAHTRLDSTPSNKGSATLVGDGGTHRMLARPGCTSAHLPAARTPASRNTQADAPPLGCSVRAPRGPRTCQAAGSLTGVLCEPAGRSPRGASSVRCVPVRQTLLDAQASPDRAPGGRSPGPMRCSPTRRSAAANGGWRGLDATSSAPSGGPPLSSVEVVDGVVDGVGHAQCARGVPEACVELDLGALCWAHEHRAG